MSARTIRRLAVLLTIAFWIAGTQAVTAAAALLGCYQATVTDVWDGDSITADVLLGFQIWRHGEKIRFLGIDAPEVRGEERPAGLVSRDALRDRILGEDVTFCPARNTLGVEQRDVYGRALGTIRMDGRFPAQHNISAWMILAGHAAPYRPPWLSPFLP